MGRTTSVVRCVRSACATGHRPTHLLPSRSRRSSLDPSSGRRGDVRSCTAQAGSRARSGCRRDRQRTTAAAPARPRSAGSDTPTGRAGGRGRRGRRPPGRGGPCGPAGSPPPPPGGPWPGPSSNQQPPRGPAPGAWAPGAGRAGPEERLGHGLGLGPGRHGQLHVVDADDPVPGRTVTVDPLRESDHGVASEWVVGGDLDQVDAQTVGVVDPGLDQAPRFQHGRAGHADAPLGQFGQGLVDAPHLQPQRPARRRVRRTGDPAARPHHLDQAASGEEDHAPSVPAPNSRATASPSASRRRPSYRSRSLGWMMVLLVSTSMPVPPSASPGHAVCSPLRHKRRAIAFPGTVHRSRAGMQVGLSRWWVATRAPEPAGPPPSSSGPPPAPKGPPAPGCVRR